MCATMKKINILYLIREKYPTFRVDVTVLFGKYLPKYGIFTSLVAKKGDKQKWSGWPAGHLFLYEAKKNNRFVCALKEIYLIAKNLKLFEIIRCITGKR